MKYDDASWHYAADDFPPQSPKHYGAVHMGVFVKLMFQEGMAGELHTKNWSQDVERVLSGEWTGTRFVTDVMDEVMTTEDFTHKGNDFAGTYYETGHYFGDFAAFSDWDLYAGPEEAVNMDAMDDVFQRRLGSFEDSGDPMKDAN